jgi:hypothetical protein
MGLADFDRIDIVARDPAGLERWVTVAGSGWPEADEARPIALFLIKMAKLWQFAAHHDKPVRMELVCIDEPPICVLEIATREGIETRVGIDEPKPAQGRATAFPNGPDGWPDVGALQQANARALAERSGLPLPPSLDALDELDALLAERRADAGVEADEESDDAFDGELVVLAGAYAGEAMLAAVGGRWAYDPGPAGHEPKVYDGDSPEGRASEARPPRSGGELVMNPIHLVIGARTINVLGKVAKFLRAGAGDSVASLARVVVQMVREDTNDAH